MLNKIKCVSNDCILNDKGFCKHPKSIVLNSWHHCITYISSTYLEIMEENSKKLNESLEKNNE